MEFFQTAQVDIPVLQIMLLLTLSTAFLIVGRIKLALLMNYAFSLYWSYAFNSHLISSIGQATISNTVYVGFGIAVAILGLVGFVANSH
ncbi:MAG: hypothetical protein SWE60_07370 [Thermodesulfobacteriota bacterium]|nr:hypothetical protein [Thermodesulfobacteriota bacterium]